LTPKEEQIEAVLEMCLVYIDQSESAEQLHSVGQEIAVVKGELGMNTKHFENVTRKYVAKRRSFNGTDK